MNKYEQPTHPIAIRGISGMKRQIAHFNSKHILIENNPPFLNVGAMSTNSGEP